MKKVIRLTESDLEEMVRRVIKEQNEKFPFKVGDKIVAIRDKDKQKYNLEVLQVGPSGSKFGMFKIMGPGMYQGQKFDGKGSYELYFEDGKLSGNMEMGTFEIAK